DRVPPPGDRAPPRARRLPAGPRPRRRGRRLRRAGGMAPAGGGRLIVHGRRFPPKQPISLLTGLDKADFTTHQARRILKRLGFVAARRTTESPPSAEP